MPVPAAIFGPGAVVGLKKFAFHALTYLDISTLSSATFAVVCLRYIYKSLPSWVKEDISFQSWSKVDGKDERTFYYDGNGGFRVQHLAEKISKLKDLLQKRQQHSDYDFSFPAVLALIQLSAQLKRIERDIMQ